MPKLLRTLIVLGLELVVFAVVITTILAAALMWRLQQGPVPVDFVKPALMERVAEADPSMALKIGSVSLTWPDWQKPLVLEITDLSLTQNGESRLALSAAAVSIARLPLLIGQIQPVAAIFREPDLRLIRTTDGGLVMINTPSDQKTRPTSPNEKIDLVGLVAAIRGFALNEPADPKVADSFWAGFLREFEAIRIESAALYFEDADQSVNWVLPDVTFEFSREDGQLKGLLTSTVTGEPLTIIALTALPDDAGGLSMSARIKDFTFISPLRDMVADALHNSISFDLTRFDASLDLSLTKQGSITQAGGTFNAPATTLHIPDGLDAPLNLTNTALDFEYRLSGELNRQGQLKVTKAGMDINGIAAALSGYLDISGAHIAGPLQLDIPKVSLDELQKVWPTSARDNVAASWLTKRLSKGIIHNLSMTTILAANEADLWNEFDDPDSWWLDTALPLGPTWSWSVNDTQANFTFDQLTADYNAPMVPATNAVGVGSYKDQTLLLEIASGNIADLSVKDAIVKIDEIETDGAGMAYITVPLEGKLATLVDYLAKEPISLDPTLIGDSKQISGNIAANVYVEFPTLEELLIEDVKVVAKGKATEASWPNIVQGLPLRNGKLDITYENDIVAVKGDGLLDDAAVTFDWTRLMNKSVPADTVISTLKAKLTANDAMRSKLGFPLSEEVTGNTTLDIDYTMMGNMQAQMTIGADLTAAELLIDALGYTKPAGIQASGKGRLLMVGEKLTGIDQLSLKLPDGSMEGGKLDFVQQSDGPYLSAGSFSKIVLPQQDFTLNFTRPQPDLYDMNIMASAFNAAPLLGNKSKTAATAAPAPATTNSSTRYAIKLKAADLRTSDKGGLKGADITLNTDKNGEVTYLQATATAGNAPVRIQFDPSVVASPPLQLQADHAGALLQAMDIYENVVGGNLVINGKPVSGKSMANMEGQMALKNFTVVKAPALARLLNAMSLTGVLQVLDSKGISFTRLEAGFSWVHDAKGKRIAMRDGRTSGASLGLTFDGMLDRDNEMLDLTGTIIPVSEVNKIINKIPLVRDILLGGKNGSLIAATYTMKGATADPKVSVNPLSVLTPGIIRKILFEQDIDKAKAEAKAATQRDMSVPSSPAGNQ